MKYNKMIIVLLFGLLFYPFCIQAEVCNKDDIKIGNIELVDTKGNALEASDSNNNNNTINLNAKMNVVGDGLTYKVVIKNTSVNDYVFDKNQILKDYIHYDISFEDNSSIIKAGEEKAVYLKLSYDNKPSVDNLSDGVLNERNEVSFILKENIINPNTGNQVFVLMLIMISFFFLSFILQIKGEKKKYLMFIIISIFGIPIFTKAACSCTLDVNLNIEIDAKEAIFLPGQEFNIKVKQLVGDDTSTSSRGYNYKDQLITAIKYSEVEPVNSNKEEKNIVSVSESRYPIYAWFDNGVLYWWSEDKSPSLNEDASYMFYYFYALEDISGVKDFDLTNVNKLNYYFAITHLIHVDDLSKWNVSSVKEMYGFFEDDSVLQDVSGLKNWDVSSVKILSSFFELCRVLRDVSPIKDWNVSNVTDMRNLFRTCYALEEIDLSHWETNSLTDMAYMFAMLYMIDGSSPSSLKRVILSDKFDTSHVTNMASTFYNVRTIEDYSFLQYFDTSSVTDMSYIFYSNRTLTNTEYMKNWDVSNVKNMSGTFFDTRALSSLQGLQNWNVSNVETMYYMFYQNRALENLDGLENWNVSNVSNFNYMFLDSSILSDSSAINDWNISNMATFSYMFSSSPTHPEFSKVPGTWNNGTFTPTN